MTGMLVNGRWRPTAAFHNEQGVFDRKPTTFRTMVAEGTPHPPAAGRYRLYVSYACPWAHRTLIVRALRKLEHAIDVAVVHPFMGEDGWSFESGEGVVPDPEGAEFLREVYLKADPNFTGRTTVPVLWDCGAKTIVNNESREIARILGRAFFDLGDRSVDLCPRELEEEIDGAIEANYESINNGVYRCGFAGHQAGYDAAVDELFAALDRVEATLSKQRYLVGDRLTEADICLFTTLIRFDRVYHTHFKCNVRRIVDYPAIWGFTRELFQMPAIRETVRFDHIREHYYASHLTINPRGIVARGPAGDLDAPHGRG